MNLKTIKVLLFTLLALTLASFLIGWGVQAGVFSVYGAVRHRLRSRLAAVLALPLLRRTPRPQRRRDLPALRQKPSRTPWAPDLSAGYD